MQNRAFHRPIENRAATRLRNKECCSFVGWGILRKKNEKNKKTEKETTYASPKVAENQKTLSVFDSTFQWVWDRDDKKRTKRTLPGAPVWYSVWLGWPFCLWVMWRTALGFYPARLPYHGIYWASEGKIWGTTHLFWRASARKPGGSNCTKICDNLQYSLFHMRGIRFALYHNWMAPACMRAMCEEARMARTTEKNTDTGILYLPCMEWRYLGGA